MPPQWATGATIWTTCKATFIQAIWDASEPYEPLYKPRQDLSSSGCSVFTISRPYVNGMYIQPFNMSCVPSEPWGNHTSTSCTSSHSGPSSSPVSPGSHYMNHIKINPFPDVLCPQWALGAISCQSYVHLAARCTMFPHWAPGATRLQHLLHLANSDVLVPLPLWAMGATIWTTSRSIHSQTFYVPNEPWEPLHINVIYIQPLHGLCVPIEPQEPPGLNTLYI